tara:strand:+ start:118 stop:249 length:132 start_codon:yes stop_codon:yes gene_type:complete
MEALIYILHWGSPIGIGLFFFLGCSGAGILFWGIGYFNQSRGK